MCLVGITILQGNVTIAFVPHVSHGIDRPDWGMELDPTQETLRSEKPNSEIQEVLDTSPRYLDKKRWVL